MIPTEFTKRYYSIGEAAALFELNTSALRFWEKEFQFVISKKNAKGNRLYSIKEIEMAISNGFIPVTLGDTRLRTETAAIVACHSVAFINQE
mgnify:CR=1 FL=1